MKGTTIPATSHNLWTGSRAIWLGVIMLRHGGTASVCDLYAYGLVQHIPHKSYTAQINYATTFAVFYFPFADPSRIFRGHMLKPFYINANTRTFRSMLTYIHTYIHTLLYLYICYKSHIVVIYKICHNIVVYIAIYYYRIEYSINMYICIRILVFVCVMSYSVSLSNAFRTS